MKRLFRTKNQRDAILITPFSLKRKLLLVKVARFQSILKIHVLPP